MVWGRAISDKIIKAPDIFFLENGLATIPLLKLYSVGKDNLMHTVFRLT